MPESERTAIVLELADHVEPKIEPACLEVAADQPQAGPSSLMIKSEQPGPPASQDDVKPKKRAGKGKAVDSGEEVRPGRVRAKPPKTTLARGRYESSEESFLNV